MRAMVPPTYYLVAAKSKRLRRAHKRCAVCWQADCSYLVLVIVPPSHWKGQGDCKQQRAGGQDEPDDDDDDDDEEGRGTRTPDAWDQGSFRKAAFLVVQALVLVLVRDGRNP